MLVPVADGGPGSRRAADAWGGAGRQSGEEMGEGRREKGRIVLACAVAHSDLIPTLQLSLSSTLFSHLLAGKLVTSLNQFYHGANESQLLNGGCIL